MANMKKSGQKHGEIGEIDRKIDKKDKDKNKNYVFAAFSLATSLGLNLAACILVGVMAGKYADSFWGTHPWLTLAGIVTGIFSGIWVIYKRIIDFEK